MQLLRVVYHRPAELVRDHDRQFVKGGLLVQGAGEGLTGGDAVELEVVAGSARVVVPCRVLQTFDGSVAVGFDRAASPALGRAVEAARALGDGAWAEGAPAELAPDSPPAPARTAPDSPPAPRPVSGAADPLARLRDASPAEKIQIALHGTRDERAAILRDVNKTLHPYVLRNPNLQLDEVTAIAKMATVAPELLKAIASRREWVSRPEVAIALVRNPKLEVTLGVRLLEYVAVADLRQLAKDTRTRPPIQTAARKKVIGPA
ncbi:MAG: hypothetical protein IT373_13620 [Polyangiaceae bacterium]|nr:hypothetical protein [Polyangiaceae bacterium]